jgi:hypothetical protein
MKPNSSRVAWVAGWAWCLLAGGGGLWLLITRGPWPPTNGWFALMSGLAACPFIGLVLRSKGTLRVSWRHQFSAAAIIFVLGHAALTIWPHK